MQDLEHAVDVASSIQTVRFHRDSTIAVPAVTQRSSSDAQLSYATFIPNLPVHDIPGIFIEKPGLLHILSNTIYWLNKFRPQATGIRFEFDFEFWISTTQAEQTTIVKQTQEYAASHNLHLEYCGPVA